MKTRFRVIAACGLVVASLLGVVGAATAAPAGPDGTGGASGGVSVQGNAVIKKTTVAYVDPAVSPHRVGTILHQGDTVQALCFTKGEDLHGSDLWFKVSHQDKRGYVHSGFVVAPTVPRC